jgi:hypothetical protein
VCSVRRWVSDLTSRNIGLGLSDLFGVGLASRTAVPLASASLFGVQAAVPPDRIIVRCSVCWVSSKRIIVRYACCCNLRKLNYCSLTHAAASWDFEHLELLFAPDGLGRTGCRLRTSQLFGIRPRSWSSVC